MRIARCAWACTLHRRGMITRSLFDSLDYAIAPLLIVPLCVHTFDDSFPCFPISLFHHLRVVAGLSCSFSLPVLVVIDDDHPHIQSVTLSSLLISTIAAAVAACGAPSTLVRCTSASTIAAHLYSTGIISACARSIRFKDIVAPHILDDDDAVGSAEGAVNTAVASAAALRAAFLSSVRHSIVLSPGAEAIQSLGSSNEHYARKVEEGSVYAVESVAASPPEMEGISTGTTSLWKWAAKWAAVNAELIDNTVSSVSFPFSNSLSTPASDACLWVQHPHLAGPHRSQALNDTQGRRKDDVAREWEYPSQQRGSSCVARLPASRDIPFLPTPPKVNTNTSLKLMERAYARAYSGGCADLKEFKEIGANIAIDVAAQSALAFGPVFSRSDSTCCYCDQRLQMPTWETCLQDNLDFGGVLSSAHDEVDVTRSLLLKYSKGEVLTPTVKQFAAHSVYTAVQVWKQSMKRSCMLL